MFWSELKLIFSYGYLMVIFLTYCTYSEVIATQPVRKQNPFIHRHLLLVYVFSCMSRPQPQALNRK